MLLVLRRFSWGWVWCELCRMNTIYRCTDGICYICYILYWLIIHSDSFSWWGGLIFYSVNIAVVGTQEDRTFVCHSCNPLRRDITFKTPSMFYLWTEELTFFQKEFDISVSFISNDTPHRNGRFSLLLFGNIFLSNITGVF